MGATVSDWRRVDLPRDVAKSASAPLPIRSRTMTTFPTWPSYTEREVDAVAETLRSNRVNYWTGTETREFEREFAAATDSRYAVALANGTLALDLALKALDIGPGDEVIVTPRSFIASVSSVVSLGAKPVFADVDRDSGNLSADTVAACITDRTRAVIPVHLAGWPCDMHALLSLCAPLDIAIIEDCAQAHGAAIGGKSVGSFGTVGAWSFCQDKIMTTGGEGGMVTTDDEGLWKRMWSYKDHGKSWDAVYERDHAPGFRWLHEDFGTNWRMMEMQGVIGRIQLGLLDGWSARRREIAGAYRAMLQPFADVVRAPWPDNPFRHAAYRFYAYVRPDGLAVGWSRDRIVAEVSALGLPLLHGTCSEIYLEKAFEGTGLAPELRLPNARELGETSLMFLTHPTLEETHVSAICDGVARILARASK